VNNARILLVGGPFDGQEVASVPPDLAAPAQIVWADWHRDGFTAWLYEWHGEVRTEGGYTTALIYRPTGRRLAADEIPPLIAEDVEVWAAAPAVWADAMRAIGIAADMMWPGV